MMDTDKNGFKICNVVHIRISTIHKNAVKFTLQFVVIDEKALRTMDQN